MYTFIPHIIIKEFASYLIWSIYLAIYVIIQLFVPLKSSWVIFITAIIISKCIKRYQRLKLAASSVAHLYETLSQTQ